MFCQNCGCKLDTGANFCSGCGAAQGRVPEPARGNDSSFKFSVYPVFNKTSYMVGALPVTIFFLIWCTIFFGGIGFVFMQGINLFLGTKFPPGFLFLVMPVIVIFLAVFVFPNVVKKNIANTAYHFYGDRVEYNTHRTFKTMSLSSILCVNLSRGVFQQKHGLGTIYLDTAGGRRHYGIVMSDIPNPEQVCKDIQDLIKNNKPV